MSNYRLNTYVHAVELNDKAERTGREQVFGPDDDLSTPENDWALAAITNDAVWADGNVPPRKQAPPAADSDEVALLKARIAELENAQAATGQGDGPKPPPRSGPGSGAAEWREYAAAVDVEVPADADRPAVIAALDAAGKPTK